MIMKTFYSLLGEPSRKYEINLCDFADYEGLKKDNLSPIMRQLSFDKVFIVTGVSCISPYFGLESFLSFVRISDRGRWEEWVFFPAAHGISGFGLLVNFKHKPAREVRHVKKVCHGISVMGSIFSSRASVSI